MKKVVIYQREKLPLDEAIDNALEKAKKEGIKRPFISLHPETMNDLEKEYAHRLAKKHFFDSIWITLFVEKNSCQPIYVCCSYWSAKIEKGTIVIAETQEAENDSYFNP